MRNEVERDATELAKRVRPTKAPLHGKRLDEVVRVARVGDPIPAALLAACPRTHADAAVARRVAASGASELAFTAAVSAGSERVERHAGGRLSRPRSPAPA